MKKFFLLLIFLSFSIHAETLEVACQEVGGKIYKKYKCPKSKLVLPVKTCEFKNDREETLFFNGCSGPSGGFKKLFLKACINHDHCYHHEPSTNGLKQKDCDLRFKNEMIESCYQNAGVKQKKCVNWAKLMYRTLRIVGSIAYHCGDSYAHYE